MNIKSLTVNLFFLFSILAFFSACSNSNNASGSTSSNTNSGNAALNIRYIDEDSLLRNYNLAKDLNEAMIRTNTNIETEANNREAEIRRFAQSVQNKMQSNGYLSEASYRADEKKLNQLQATAQKKLAEMQQVAQNEMIQNQIQLNDSVDNFIREYNKEKGYDMIIKKSATFIIDPKYDITGEIIEGLNARYNKVSKK